MKSRKRDTSGKRESILHAAMQVFSDEGYDKASMDRIAQAAGASKRTVYNHFPGKDELFQAVLKHFFEKLHSLKQIRYDETRSLAEQLSDFAEAELTLVNNPVWMGLSKLLISVFIRTPELVMEVKAKYGPAEDTLITWIEAAVKNGRMSAPDPRLAARVFNSMVEGALTWPAMIQGSPLKAEIVRELKQEIIETFLCRYSKK